MQTQNPNVFKCQGGEEFYGTPEVLGKYLPET